MLKELPETPAEVQQAVAQLQEVPADLVGLLQGQKEVRAKARMGDEPGYAKDDEDQQPAESDAENGDKLKGKTKGRGRGKGRGKGRGRGRGKSLGRGGANFDLGKGEIKEGDSSSKATARWEFKTFALTLMCLQFGECVGKPFSFRLLGVVWQVEITACESQAHI